MRIALDVTPTARPQSTGIGRYARHLALALAETLEEEDELSLCTRLSRWRMRDLRVRHPRARNRWFQAPWGPAGRPQIFHGTDFRLPERSRAALIVTVHDVFNLDSEDWAPPRFRALMRQRCEEISLHADRIVFDSCATQERYLAHFPDARARGHVVHLGIDPEFRPSSPERVARLRARYGLPDHYALYVGEVSLRKNLTNQAQALLASGSGLPWVWVGRDGFGGPAIQSEIQRLRGLSVLRPGYLPAEDLPALYSGATLLTFVSHDEGFGLPALEAMACGTPAVVADRGALPEVTGDAALHADPADPQSIAEAIARLADDGDLRERLRERGIERARSFSWKKTAEETRAVYREALAAA